MLEARPARLPVEAHVEKCGSCAGQLSAVVGVVPLHARTRSAVWEAAQDSRSVRGTFLVEEGRSERVLLEEDSRDVTMF